MGLLAFAVDLPASGAGRESPDTLLRPFEWSRIVQAQADGFSSSREVPVSQMTVFARRRWEYSLQADMPE